MPVRRRRLKRKRTEFVAATRESAALYRSRLKALIRENSGTLPSAATSLVWKVC